MTKIDLTPAELREFARLSKKFRLTLWSSEDEWPRWQELRDRVGGQPLALALADAMEERDRLREEVNDYENREAACCPEDFGFDELIAKLRADLSSARKVIRLVTWESIAGANRRNGKEPPEQWRNFSEYGYYLADPDEDTYIECPIPDEHIPTVRAAYAEEHTDGDD